MIHKSEGGPRLYGLFLVLCLISTGIDYLNIYEYDKYRERIKSLLQKKKRILDRRIIV